MKKILTLICTLLCANVLLAQTTFTRGDLIYGVTSTNPAEVEVHDANLSITTANIPETVSYGGTTYSVTSIGQEAFASCSSLTSITIPNSVTSIGDWAFASCSSLTSITIPNSVTSIGGGVFSNCSSLTSVTLSNNITELPCYNNYNSYTNSYYGFFFNCSSLTSITIPNSVTSIGNRAFKNCSSLTSVDIPNSVTSIGASAFENCNSLTSVDIPNSVTSIGGSAFENCNSLTSVDIPNSVTSIGEDAFKNCSSLTSVTIPNSVTSIGNSAFRNCSSLTSVTIPNSVTSIRNNAFYSCSSLTSIDIPNSVTSINDYAFKNCSSLTSVTIPNSVTSIYREAFKNCSSLTSVTCLRSNSPSLDNDVFDGTPNNKTLTIPCGCESEYTDWQNANTWASINCIVTIGSRFTIGNFTYEVTSETEVKVQDCTQSVTSVVIPETGTYQETTYSVTSIGDWAFSDCIGLTSVDIPNSVTSIGDGAFFNCRSLTSVDIPNSVTSIGNSAFYLCSSLTSIDIPNSVTSIGDNAFWTCSSLTSIDIPNSVTSIGNSAFGSCDNLTSVTIPNSVTSIGEYAFNGCSSLTSITIPNSVTSIGNYAFNGCSSLTSMTIEMNNVWYFGNIGLSSTLRNLTLGENVTSIGSGAFNYYHSLRNVTCLATTPPTLEDNSVFSYPNIASLKVPCGTLESYSAPASLWNFLFADRISENIYNVVATANDNAFGSVAVESDCSTATLTATASDCYEFLRWNDGNTDNPRIISFTSDTSFVANFIISTVNEITATICQGQTYTENGFNVSEAGVYTQTYTSVNGCDSIVTLTVSVNPTFDTTINATINSGETYSEFGFNESESGTYVQNLQTVNGCDSTITLNLTVNSSLYDVAEFADLSVYPNPTSGKVSFNQAIEKIEVIDLSGKTVQTYENVNEINMESLPAGVYHLRMTIEDKITTRKVIKE